jgi:glycosyltransferase involved in cell wall biosynthesis
VSHDASRSGAPIVLLSFLMVLQKIAPERGINLWIVLDRGGDLEPEFAACGPTLTIDHLVDEDYNREQAWRDVLTSFRQFAPEGMALINTAAVPQVHQLCAQAQIPVMSWIHELPSVIDLYLGGYRSFRHVLASSRRIICASDAVRQAIAGYAPEANAELITSTLYYGAMPPRFQQTLSANGHLPGATPSPHSSPIDRTAILKEFNLPERSFLVLGCGSVEHRKGCDIFLQVANYLVRTLQQRDMVFLWLGRSLDPTYWGWLQRDIFLMGLSDYVMFPGVRPNPGQYMRGCDVFALTSREDPFPLVNLEAMYYGCPVVSFRGAGGAPEIHSQGRGIAVSYLDAVAMAEAIAHLKQNPDLAHQIGTTGQQYVQRELTWEKLVDQVLGILAEEFGYAPRSFASGSR